MIFRGGPVKKITLYDKSFKHYDTGMTDSCVSGEITARSASTVVKVIQF